MKARLALILYALLGALLMPFLMGYLVWRARRQPAYLAHWGERFGRFPRLARPDPLPVIWIHAVSVGETRAAQPFIQALLKTYPHHRLVLTQMTPTGRETAQQLWGNLIEIVYLPYDFPVCVQGFFKAYRPQCGFFLETEVWPFYLFYAEKQGIPLFLVNARLSERSARGYQKIRALMEPAFGRFTAVWAQTEADFMRLKGLGVKKGAVVGNLKFDVQPKPDKVAQGWAWKTAWQRKGLTVILASSREGEEILFLNALKKVGELDSIAWMIVPRHPQRFEEVATLMEAEGLSFSKRTDGGFPEFSKNMILGNSLGDMEAYYSMADVVLMGGSFVECGGQNLIEACALGCPVLFGQSMFNFQEASEWALKSQAALQVPSFEEALLSIKDLVLHPEKLHAMKASALAFAQQHQGATLRTLNALKETLNHPIKDKK